LPICTSQRRHRDAIVGRDEADRLGAGLVQPARDPDARGAHLGVVLVGGQRQAEDGERIGLGGRRGVGHG
jgi:hypothetical protein